MSKKYLILGAFGYREKKLNGQTVKTRNIWELIKKNYSDHSVDYYDTEEIKYSKWSLFTMIFKILSNNTLIYIPAHNNLKFFFPILFLLSKLRNTTILYIVVGGWLADYLESLPIHTIFLKKIKNILVETNLLKEKLEKKYSFSNIEVLHNFRSNNFILPSLKKNVILKLVFMARINKFKGLETIFSFAEFVRTNKLDISIDFYGPVYEQDNGYFMDQVSRYDFVKFHGELDPEKIHETLTVYDVLLLPTKYYTEGFPGSILDAYISGIPVIVTKWLYATEFVEDGMTGYIIPFDKPQEEFNKKILEIYMDRERLRELKINAFKKSKDFSEEKSWEILQKSL